jgi:fumarate reductase flavoprotein subunit
MRATKQFDGGKDRRGDHEMKKLWKTMGAVLVALMTALILSVCETGSGGAGGGENLSYSADIIIVGAGGAGLSATIEARKTGASVILLEKSSVVGGNTLPANAGLSAVGTDEQEAAGYGSYTVQNYIDFHLEKGETNNPDLVRILAEKSRDTVEWLKSMGLRFVIRTLGATGPGMFGDDRITLSAPDNQTIGSYLIPALAHNAEASGAKIFFETTATELITEGGRVTGVKARDNVTGETLTFMGAVLLTTGGYGQDNAMVAEYAPQYAGIITDEVAPTTGDGIKMAVKLGAATQDLDQLMVIGMVEAISHDTILPPWVADGSIFVNYEGKRFGRENEHPFFDPTPAPPLPEGVKEAMEVLDGYPADKKQFYYVFGKSILADNPNLQPYIYRGCAAQGTTPEELAGKLGVNAANLKETIDKWNAVINGGGPDEFGRSEAIHTNIDAPYYALRVNSGVHYCMGGLKINTKTQVLKTDGSVISGLFAAGEVTGGVHGKYRVDGSAVTDSLLFGRLGAQEAAAYAFNTVATKGSFANGVHQGSAYGRNGLIVVEVTVVNGNITKIEIISDTETSTMKDSVERVTIPSIIDKQSVEGVDTVSGATFTYIGTLNAVKDALGI